MSDEKCYICGFDADAALEEHHIIPRALDGSDADGNVVTLCANCHKAVTAMYGRWFFAEIWEIYAEMDHPPELTKSKPPKGLTYNNENRLTPDPDDDFDDVIDAFQLIDRGLNPYEIERRTGISKTTVRELPDKRSLYAEYLEDDTDLSSLSDFQAQEIEEGT